MCGVFGLRRKFAFERKVCSDKCLVHCGKITDGWELCACTTEVRYHGSQNRFHGMLDPDHQIWYHSKASAKRYRTCCTEMYIIGKLSHSGGLDMFAQYKSDLERSHLRCNLLQGHDIF